MIHSKLNKSNSSYNNFRQRRSENPNAFVLCYGCFLKETVYKVGVLQEMPDQIAAELYFHRFSDLKTLHRLLRPLAFQKARPYQNPLTEVR